MRRLIVLLVVCAIIAAGIWLWLQPRTADTATGEARGATTTAPVTASLKPKPAADAAPAAAATPDPQFVHRRAELEQRAAQGDAVAAGELGGLLVQCWRHAPMTTANIEEAVVNALASDIPPPRLGGQPLQPELLVLALQLNQEDLARRCGNVAGQVSWEDGPRALPLLIQAAEAGQTRAMLDYARNAFIDYASVQDMLQDAAGVKARKERAQRYLQQALRAGEAEALLQLTDAYAYGGLQHKDPVAAYAHLLAFIDNTDAGDWPPRLGELYAQALVQDLDAAQQAQAREQALLLTQEFRQGRRP